MSATGISVNESPALEIDNVRAGYENVEILHGVSISIPPSRVVALLGPNGAGKTTTLRVISGRIRPSSGAIRIDGRDIARRSADDLARSGVCSIPEGRGVFPSLTVAENLKMWTFRDRSIRVGDVEEQAFARFPVLSQRRKQLAGTLSGGEQQMLAMSRVLATKPKLLLLDEISMGLAPMVVTELYEVVSQVAAEGFAILVVEQFARMVLKVADRAVIMTQGKIFMEGSPADIEAAIADVYLSSDATRQSQR